MREETKAVKAFEKVEFASAVMLKELSNMIAFELEMRATHGQRYIENKEQAKIMKQIEAANRRDNARLAKAQRDMVARRDAVIR